MEEDSAGTNKPCGHQSHIHKSNYLNMPLLNPCVCMLNRSVTSDSAIPWTVTHQAPPSMGFPRQEYWSGLPFPSPGDLPNPGIEPGSPAALALTGGLCTRPNLEAAYKCE